MNSGNTKPLLLGTRGSQLALWQSNWVKSQLESHGQPVELVILKTEGDVATGPLAQIGGQGLFTKRLQTALLENEIDLAVHSLKDLPTNCPDELTIAAVPHRESEFDALISNQYSSLAELPKNAIVGTGSVRRMAQLRYVRPDLVIRDLRGNVDTRLEKLDAKNYDAIILACAGLIRLGQEDRIAYRFTIDEMLPAVGQGALGIEIRKNDLDKLQCVELLNHPVSQARTLAERTLLRKLNAGCMAPVGAFSSVIDDDIELVAAVLDTEGKQKIQTRHTMPIENAEELGGSVGERLLELGADQFLT